MLVLTRQPGEKIAIGPDIQIEVMAVEPTQAKLGISAPRSLPVMRAELAAKAAGERPGKR